MQLNLSILTGKDRKETSVDSPNTEASPLIKSKAWDEISSAWSNATDTTQPPEELARRQAWVGGAIKIYAILTGEDAEQLRSLLSPGSPSGAVSAPNSRYGSILASAVPVKPARPPKHPGAQRPVPLDEVTFEEDVFDMPGVAIAGESLHET